MPASTQSMKIRLGIAIYQDTSVYGLLVSISVSQYLLTFSFTSFKQEYFKAAIDSMAANSLRCVAIAYRSYELGKIPKDEEHLSQWALPEDELVLLGIVGIKVSIKTQASHDTAQ